MMIELGLAAKIAAAIVAGWLMAWLVLRSRVSRAFAPGKAALTPELERLSDALGRQQSAVRALDAQLALKEQALRKAEEKLALLQDARQELSNQFRVLAQEIFEEKGRVFGEQSRAGLKGLIDPFRDADGNLMRPDVIVHLPEEKCVEKLGKEIHTVQGTCDEAMNRLVRGRGNVISQAARFCELGVPIKKALPRTVMDLADIQGAAADDDPVDPPE